MTNDYTNPERGGEEYGFDRPNLGSARSDYGKQAYGGRLDEQGLGKGGSSTSGGRDNRGDVRAWGKDERKGTLRSSRFGTSTAVGGGNMNTGLLLLGGISLGAALMYALDPDRGARRRALVKDKLASAATKTPDALGATGRDMANRARGLAASVKSAFTSGDATDEVIVQRVRSRVGRVVSHPSAIEVTAESGRVTLSGLVLTREVDNLLSTVGKVRGVRQVENRLEAHEQPGDVPGLQGGRARPDGDRFELMQENWSPTARVLTTLTGGALAIYGLGRRDALGVGLGVIGAGLALRGATNTEMKRLMGAGTGRRADEINETTNSAAPMESAAEDRGAKASEASAR